jgi:superfamily II DNA or RNA helicase
VVRVLTNVNTLTEGVDVPEARTCILARSFGHVGGYLQAAGRVLRAAPGKESAVVVDLTGATIRHGLPTTDRTYSLSGRAISGGAAFGGGGQAPEFSQSVRGVELVQVSGSPMPTATIEREANKVDARAERERLATVVASMGLRPAVADILFAQRFGGSR